MVTTMGRLSLIPRQTQIFQPGDSLSAFVIEALAAEPPRDGQILAVTTKIVSLAENRLVARDSIDKKALIEREADQILAELAHNCTLTLKHGLMMISAGIDESNSPTGDYILYPEDPWASARQLRAELCAHFGLKNFGILLTDSHTIPLRRGVVGISLAHAGFRGTRDCIGEKDVFGRELKFTHQDIADALAAAAVLVMGEGGERRPLVMIEGADAEFLQGEDDSPLRMAPEEDLYYPFFAKKS